jgi:hypothetical protein
MKLSQNLRKYALNVRSVTLGYAHICLEPVSKPFLLEVGKPRNQTRSHTKNFPSGKSTCIARENRNIFPCGAERLKPRGTGIFYLYGSGTFDTCTRAKKYQNITGKNRNAGLYRCIVRGHFLEFATISKKL